MRLTVNTVLHDADCPEKMRVEAEKRQEQAEHESARDLAAAEHAGAERMADDQVSLAGHGHDQPHRVVTDLHTTRLLRFSFLASLDAKHQAQMSTHSAAVHGNKDKRPWPGLEFPQQPGANSHLGKSAALRNTKT